MKKIDKIVKEKGNYVLVNRPDKLIISVITEDMIRDKLTIYPQPGDELLDGTLEEALKLYPDYTLMTSELDRNKNRKLP